MPGNMNNDAENDRDKLGLSKSSKSPGRNEAEEIEKKLKEIKEKMANITEIIGGHHDLVTFVDTETLTKTVKTFGGFIEKKGIVKDDEKPSTSAAANAFKTSPQLTKNKKPDEQIFVSPVAKMFVLRPDGTHDIVTGHSPLAEPEQVGNMREITTEDGSLIILTGGNGEVVYHPEDTVAIDITDSRVFILDAKENGVTFVEKPDTNDIIEYLPEEEDTETKPATPAPESENQVQGEANLDPIVIDPTGQESKEEESVVKEEAVVANPEN
ncbi:uncharacterized protein LOC108103664 isoform X2 [Drosophila eugracilis]|nr:uncharacterized protein LOC108103664 isoform X2 [Drosophila eugracilis]XP_017064712.1 uncharacterized protein LOC108103664 isoform X2 [Drosophila eugracilis]